MLRPIDSRAQAKGTINLYPLGYTGLKKPTLSLSIFHVVQRSQQRCHLSFRADFVLCSTRDFFAHCLNRRHAMITRQCCAYFYRTERRGGEDLKSSPPRPLIRELGESRFCFAFLCLTASRESKHRKRPHGSRPASLRSHTWNRTVCRRGFRTPNGSEKHPSPKSVPALPGSGSTRCR